MYIYIFLDIRSELEIVPTENNKTPICKGT